MKLIDILRSLAQPVPRDCISHKTLKGNKIDYIAWYDLCDLLDDHCGIDGWEWCVKDVNQISNRLTLTGILTIHGEDKSLTRMATGTEDVDCSSYGDPSSNAEAMALRRCCSKFGLGRDLWRKEIKSNKNYSISKSTKKPIPKGQISREEWERRKLQKKQKMNPDHDLGVLGDIH